MKKFLFITLALFCSSLLNHPTQAQTIYGSISKSGTDQGAGEKHAVHAAIFLLIAVCVKTRLL